MSTDQSTQPPPPIHQLSAPDLKAMLESGTALQLVDVRMQWESETARIDGFRLLDQAYHDELLQLDRDTPMVFQCHHGVRSQQAAGYFREHGFRNLYNLQGGIDAWSVLVDPSVPRY
jgi:monothiol glutaredoxin